MFLLALFDHILTQAIKAWTYSRCVQTSVLTPSSFVSLSLAVIFNNSKTQQWLNMNGIQRLPQFTLVHYRSISIVLPSTQIRLCSRSGSAVRCQVMGVAAIYVAAHISNYFQSCILNPIVLYIAPKTTSHNNGSRIHICMIHQLTACLSGETVDFSFTKKVVLI